MSAVKLEMLEHRFLLAGGSAVLAPDGTLIVTGTPGDDEIYLNGGGDSATVNDVSFPFEDLSVLRAVVRSLGGDDYVQLGENYAHFAPVTIDLGNGDDRALIGDNSPDVIGGKGNDVIQLVGVAWMDSFADEGGVDTLDLEGSHRAISTLDMNDFPGLDNALASPYHVIGNDLDNFISLRSFGDQHDAYGGRGGDTLVGGEHTNFLDGGSGDDVLVDPFPDFFGSTPPGYRPDTFVGGSGRDTIDYSNRDLPLSINLAAGLGGMHHEIDNLIGLENALGGSSDDLLIGNGDRNILSGGAGNDTLNGGGDKDTLIAGAGDDLILSRDNKRDALFGGDGFDSADRDKKDRVLEVEA